MVINYLSSGRGIDTNQQITLMKSIQTLLDLLKELISESAQNRSGYNNMRLIPLPVKTQERKLPNQNNNH
ncbi:MAG TPA: hypothetical protein DIC22_00600 [Chitinophagaceae bacterium]|nr:hypothetical protein [Chitinophagaceae bacterium]